MMTASEYKSLIDDALSTSFSGFERLPQRELAESMRYSLLAGGKRIRGMLVLELCRMCGGKIEDAIDAACGIEMLHAYSLIHDDLPCMDNDDLRRGKPTNHRVYGECTATLAGDALQAEAFRTILSSPLPPERRVECALILSEAVGLDGMCGGQYLDMAGEGRKLTSQELTDINSRKTGALIIAACRMGVACAGGNRIRQTAAGHYGAAIGSAFQIRDDMLDVLSTDSELGKPVGSDKNENKNTYMALYGREKCEEMIEKLTAFAKGIITEAFDDTAFLEELADSLAVRTS